MVMWGVERGNGTAHCKSCYTSYMFGIQLQLPVILCCFALGCLFLFFFFRITTVTALCSRKLMQYEKAPFVTDTDDNGAQRGIEYYFTVDVLTAATSSVGLIESAFWH